MTTLSTADKQECIVSISYGEDCREEAEPLIDALGKEIALVEVTRTGEPLQDRRSTQP